PGERVAVIGRNGTGKSTLLRVLSGELVPDAGAIWRAPELRAARLEQDATMRRRGEGPREESESSSAAARAPGGGAPGALIFDVVADGLGDLRDAITNYHHAAAAVAENATPAALERLGRVQHEL